GVCSRGLELAREDPTYHEKPKFIKRSDGKIQVVDENGEPVGEPMDQYPEMPKVTENVYWKMARIYDVESRLKALNRKIALQGETYGEGLQKNPLQIREQKFAIFNVYDISQMKYLSLDEMKQVVDELNAVQSEGLKLELVPVL